MVSTLARNARDVGSIPTLGAIFPVRNTKNIQMMLCLIHQDRLVPTFWVVPQIPHSVTSYITQSLQHSQMRREFKQNN